MSLSLLKGKPYASNSSKQINKTHARIVAKSLKKSKSPQILHVRLCAVL
ncbi:hypothetical protein HBZS_100680 [Helicobacter bizzozeronii CCUG 35545]|nr:hypothetical protein HBZS_100680 [Helicobacter bizzozeronii CCUG 35545]